LGAGKIFNNEALLTPFSWDKAQALKRLGGDENLLRELCEIFLEESPKMLGRLRQALTEGDAATVMHAAHSLKGEVSYLGAPAALQAARQLEDMGRENRLAGGEKIFSSLERELAGLHFAMKDPAGMLQ
jgi:HPt (histidine-containing phosphotransfer) domain-containing protein